MIAHASATSPQAPNGKRGIWIGDEDLDALSLLRLQVEWGADEALEVSPVDRMLSPSDLAAAPEISRPRNLPAADRLAVPTAAPAGGQRPSAATRGLAMSAQEAAQVARDLPSLRDAIAGFDGCSLRDTATNLVFAEGNPQARLVVVGEVPDADEDRAARPFAGPPGQLLDRMLDSIGFDRQRLLLTPLISWRPPGDRPPSAFHLSVCLPFLERLLVLIQPTHLLLMGSRPTKLLTGTTIRTNAGWLPVAVPGLSEQTRAIAMRHPAYLLNHLPARRDAWADLLLLRTTMGDPT